jgi:ankyrin repeat protein
MPFKRVSVARQRSYLWSLLRAIAAGDDATTARLLGADSSLALEIIHDGATRENSTSWFLPTIQRQVYAGDTALHIAAAAYRADIARELVERGASVAARNRRGAEPLHYAAVGAPGSKHWNPHAQAATIAYLIRAGADANAMDKIGVTSLHRAVRTRCAAAVDALLAHGADARRKNKSGSTPLHLAVQTTGRGGSGTDEAREQQALIIRTLIEHGARPTDKDGHGRSVAECARNENVRRMLLQRPARP